MFNAISWQGYWITLALLSSIYYAAILLLFFREDLKAWLHKKSNRVWQTAPATQGPEPHASQTPVQPSLFGEDIAADFQAPPAGSEEHRVYACMDELNAFFEAARSRKWSRGELLQALRLVLSKYPSIKESEYRHTLGQVILSQCEHDCSIHLKAEEVAGLWL